MKESALAQAGKRGGRSVAYCSLLAALSVAIASCTATSDRPISLGQPGFNGLGPAAQLMADVAAEHESAAGPSVATQQAEDGATAEIEAALPAEVAYMPTLRPGANAAAPAGNTAPSPGGPREAEAVPAAAPAAEEPPSKPGFFASLFGSAAEEPAPRAASMARQEPPAAPPPPGPAAEAIAPSPVAADRADAQSAEEPVTAERAEAAAAQPAEPPSEPQRKGFFATLFGAPAADATPAPDATAYAMAPNGRAATRAATAARPVEATDARPVIDMAKRSPIQAQRPVNLASLSSPQGGTALPGVRQSALFEIKRRNSMDDDDSDIDLYEDGANSPVRVASAAGLARLAPNGLMVQREGVDVACLRPALVRKLRAIESRFGRKVVITSGYRSPAHNRKVRGARNSMHMHCAAADIHVPGVSKWDVARFVRAMPGRGGVGTYCHTDIVHVDVGPERDWNWRCRRRS